MKRHTLLRLLSMVEGKKWYWAGLAGSSLSPMLRNLVVAVWLMTIIDTSIAGDIPGMINSSLLGFIAMILMSVFYTLSNYAWEKGVTLTTASIRCSVFEHVQRLPFGYTQMHHSGDIISRATNDIKAAEDAYGQSLLDLLSDVLGAVISLGIVFLVNWRLALAALLLGIVFILINIPLAKALRGTSNKVQTSLGTLTETLSDILASAPVTRIFGLSRVVTIGYKQQNAHVLRLSLRRVVLSSALASLGILGFLGSEIGLATLGGHLVLRDQATLGEIVFITQMISALFITLGTVFGRLQASLAGADRILEILDAPAEPIRYALPIADTNNCAAISINNLSFSYDPNSPVLDGVDIQVPPGNVYALVGSSGGGKSTLLKLLLGLHPPDSGAICVNGYSVPETTLSKLREQVAFVPQESWLFAASIAENISCGKEGAAPEEIEAAAKAANAHDFIVQLPQGYDTPVGERGSHLSGGQRQRIAIARALLKDAPVLLLDEATSALDTESEQLVQKALATLMAGRTTLVVAHRLSTIQNADQILVLDKGKVAEQGTHQELLEQAGIYRRLYEIQFSQQESVSA